MDMDIGKGDAARIIIEAACDLFLLHRMGMYHRDIKPVQMLVKGTEGEKWGLSPLPFRSFSVIEGPISKRERTNTIAPPFFEKKLPTQPWLKQQQS